MNSPFVVLILSFVAMALAALTGDYLRGRVGAIHEEEREDFNIVLGATLTLLGLIIGFTFSMAISRYDQRKNYEEAEANAIGTEYVRADLLPPGDSAKVRGLLKKYLDERILFYTTQDSDQLVKVDQDTAELENQLSSAAR